MGSPTRLWKDEGVGPPPPAPSLVMIHLLRTQLTHPIWDVETETQLCLLTAQHPTLQIVVNLACDLVLRGKGRVGRLL